MTYSWDNLNSVTLVSNVSARGIAISTRHRWVKRPVGSRGIVTFAWDATQHKVYRTVQIYYV